MNSATAISPEILAMLRVAVAGAQLIVAGIVGFAAIQFYRWQRSSKDKESFVNSVARYHAINRLVIDNPDIQDIERHNHFVSSELSREDVIKMFYYFENLNGMGSILTLKGGKLVIPESDKGTYHVSVVRNIGRAMYKDREFIRRHCLPRGYTETFVEFLDGLWDEIGSELKAQQVAETA
ncbi:hypothetical protein FIU85_00125 [Roseovarius sp. THAF8]|uniref:hypothetical protein n=1 Tax=Roseovarius sp. THAF8 TaxID=2587846 RepID=UPI0012694DA0|nr:hypothetical protein [Roseovarius sp. THAF8]QFT95697.1 hypothetical protein FIU85_00125 [Roseovarius sp. THAF8]